MPKPRTSSTLDPPPLWSPMDSTRRFVAPGKVVLIGEYAVLDGAPAIVAAVNRGVQCRFTPGGSKRQISAPDLRFVEPALQAVSAPMGHYEFQPFNPPQTASKAGLGSSAAATVVAALAGSAISQRPLSRAELLKIALEVHRRVQGSGSGIDVAASVYGGVIRFQRDQVHHVAPVEPMIIWTGASAKTGPRVEQYLRWTDREAFVADSTHCVDSFETDPIAAIYTANTVLLQMAEAAGIDYRTPALDQIIELAQAYGGAAKASGAGGGDCAVALFSATGDRTGFHAECRKRGYPLITARLSEGAHEAQLCPK